MDMTETLAPPPKANDDLPEGTRRIIDGLERVLYDGYWIKTYPVPADSDRKSVV